MIAMPALFLDQEQAELRHLRQMAACSLGAYCRHARQFRGGQRSAADQRMQHGGTRGIAGKRGDLSEFGGARHGHDLDQRGTVLGAQPARCFGVRRSVQPPSGPALFRGHDFAGCLRLPLHLVANAHGLRAFVERHVRSGQKVAGGDITIELDVMRKPDRQGAEF
jgi:hypothetical protein